MSGLIVLLKQFALTLCHEHFKNIDPSIHIRFKSLNYFPSVHANFIQYFKQLVRHYAICNVLGIFDFLAVKRVNVLLNIFHFEFFVRYGWGRFALKTIWSRFEITKKLLIKILIISSVISTKMCIVFRIK